MSSILLTSLIISLLFQLISSFHLHKPIHTNKFTLSKQRLYSTLQNTPNTLTTTTKNNNVQNRLYPEIEVPSSFIDERTYECLDFDYILNTLENTTVTILGRQICRTKIANNSQESNLNYAMIEQLLNIITFLPIRTNMNIYPVINAIERNLSPPEREDLADFSLHIEQIVELYDYMLSNIQHIPLYTNLISYMKLPERLIECFLDSFDDEGQLNAEKYPIIKKYRININNIKGKIIQILQTLLRSMEMKEKIADT